MIVDRSDEEECEEVDGEEEVLSGWDAILGGKELVECGVDVQVQSWISIRQIGGQPDITKHRPWITAGRQEETMFTLKDQFRLLISSNPSLLPGNL